MEHIILSPLVYRPTEVDGIWAKTRALLYKHPCGGTTKIAECIVSFYRYVDDTAAADDYVTAFSQNDNGDFTPEKKAIKYIFQDVTDSLRTTKK